MMRKMFSYVALVGLTVVLVAPEAEACHLFKKRSQSSCNTGCNSGCGNSGVRYASQPGMPYGTQFATSQPTYYYQSNGQLVAGYSPMPLTMPSAPVSQPGTVTVMLPSADAQIWIDDTANSLTGKERTFNTTALEDGKTYTYQVKARWTSESGKIVEKTLPATVRAGKTSTVDFR